MPSLPRLVQSPSPLPEVAATVMAASPVAADGIDVDDPAVAAMSADDAASSIMLEKRDGQ